MKTALFYDTETTGLPDFKAPSSAEHQPHIVQLGACLVDLDTRKTIAALDLIVKPEGWTIPDDIAAIHGITTEHAAAVGVSESLAVELLLEMVRQTQRIAHNESFDARIVRIACKRFFDDHTADQWGAGESGCTAVLSTPILALPPTPKMVAAGFRKHKTPNLGEAYRFFTGRELQNAHSAMADVQACMAVWFAIQDGVREAVRAPNHEDRVRDEAAQLNERLSKLISFFSTDRFETLSPAERSLLTAQHAAMCDYSNCLSERIAGFASSSAAAQVREAA